MSMAWAIVAAAFLAQAAPMDSASAAADSIAAVVAAAPAPTTAPDEHVKDVQARAVLEPNVIPFHRQARLRLEVEAPSTLDVTFPRIAEHLAGVAIYGKPEHEEVLLKDGRKRTTETYTLDAIFANDYPLGPIEVAWSGATRLLIPAPGLRVRALTDEEKKLADQFAANAGPIDLPKHTPWIWAGIAAGVIAAAAGLAWWLQARRRAARPPAPPAPPWETAYAQLRALDERQLPSQGHVDAFYVELSGILRYYIEGRFRLHAPEQTTPEFLAEAGTLGVLTPDHQQLLASFLRHCDRVKFAKYEPGVEEMDQAFTVVLRFVDDTVPKTPKEDAA